jgi:hypothetical protein
MIIVMKIIMYYNNQSVWSLDYDNWLWFVKMRNFLFYSLIWQVEQLGKLDFQHP